MTECICNAGIIDTGNNCIPCERCPKGGTAFFSDARNGWQQLLAYNHPGNLRRPVPWVKAIEQDIYYEAGRGYWEPLELIDLVQSGHRCPAILVKELFFKMMNHRVIYSLSDGRISTEHPAIPA